MTDCDDVGPLDDVLLPCQFLPVLPRTTAGRLLPPFYVLHSSALVGLPIDTVQCPVAQKRKTT